MKAIYLRNKTLYWLVGLILTGASPVLLAQTPLLEEKFRDELRSLISSPIRSEDTRERNRFRHPLETLDFFEVRPDLTVVEIWPGGQGGWYRSILEPYLDNRGTYIPVRSDSDFPVTLPNVSAGSADSVLVFRAHGFMIYDLPAQDYFNAIFSMLTPGGIFGIVDHRGDESVPQDPIGTNGYVNQSHVVMLAEKAGFKLVDQAEINANPADSKDHRNGVYSLPPTLRGSFLNRGERARFLEIGESDRMTLKFIKP